MNSSLPCYRIGREQVEAFMILAIEFPDIGLRLCGPRGIRHAARLGYVRENLPHIGGYYLRLRNGHEFFLEADEFEMYYRPMDSQAYSYLSSSEAH